MFTTSLRQSVSFLFHYHIRRPQAVVNFRHLWSGFNRLSIISSPCHVPNYYTPKRSSISVAEAAKQEMDNLSPADNRLLKILKLEHDLFLSTGVRVPEHVSDEDWLKLLYECKTISSRKKYYTYLFKIEKSQQNKAHKSIEKKIAREALLQDLPKNDLGFKNTYLLRILDSTMNKWYDNNLCYALLNGPHLVFDFSFENKMTDHELSSLTMQVSCSITCREIDTHPSVNLTPIKIISKPYT